MPLDAVVAMSSVFRAHSTLVEINLSYAELSDLEVCSPVVIAPPVLTTYFAGAKLVQWSKS